MERNVKKWFKRDIIVLISFLILFVSISFLVNIGKEMSLPGFRTLHTLVLLNFHFRYLTHVVWKLLAVVMGNKHQFGPLKTIL